MLITAVCPRCETRYRLDESMRGKRTRCPNPLCREVFEVRDVGDAPAPTADAAPRPPEPSRPDRAGSVITGSVADLIPLLPAEVAEPAAPVVENPPEPRERRKEKPNAAPKPKEPRPGARPQTSPATPSPAPAPALAPARVPASPLDFPDDFPGDDTPDVVPDGGPGPIEAGPGTWEAPPVRGTAAVAVEAPPTPAGVPAASALSTQPADEPVRRSRRRPLMVIALMLVLLAATLGVFWWLVESQRAGSESDRFQQAVAKYENGEYDDARDALQKLIRDFPESRDQHKYHFLAELSGVRGEVADAHKLDELRPALAHVRQFVEFNQNDPLLKDRRPDVWSTLRLLAERLAAAADKEHDPQALAQARDAWKIAGGYQPPAKVDASQVERKLAEAFDRVAENLKTYARRQAVIVAIQERLERPTAAGVRESRTLAAAEGLKDDPEVAGLLAQLVQAHKDAITYTAAPADARPEPIDEDRLPGLLVTPALLRPKAGPSAGGGVAVTLARGVLYAFDPVHGTVRWARRVGSDTTALPLRVPADVITPELFLVLSTDSRSVTAVVAATGEVVWQCGLQAAVKGRPVLVGRSLLVPTLEGRVVEIEISAGRRLGHYDLGQRLAVGGARQPGTSLVYFPGDDFCVYVLDVARRTCAAVLYANHPAGSLRGPPILLGDATAEAGKGPAGWMLLCQAKGTQATEFRPFKLPIRDPDQAPAEPMPQVAGLSWSPPWHDAEKLALATDGGILSVWGIRQRGNEEDPLLFPLDPEFSLGGAGPGRAEVVYADAAGYWVLAGGRLQRLDAALRPDAGPGLLPVWSQPPALGSPLHAARPHHGVSGRTALLLTTLALDRPSCLLTAVDAGSGQFRWQRQLGLVTRCPPAVVGDRVLLRDATGLLLLDPAQFPDQPAVPWRPPGDFIATDVLPPDDHVVVLPGKDEFVQLAWPADPKAAKLRVRRVSTAGTETSATHNLPAAIAGTPALGDGFVLLPLDDGVAVRLELGDGGGRATGPSWRDPAADEQAPGHIVRLAGDDFLLTDGRRGLVRISWPGGRPYQRRTATELKHRVLAPPAVLPGDTPRLCVATAGDTPAQDTLTLLDGKALQELRQWALPGKLTAGPFVRGSGILCVVDHRRLVWFDPGREESWEYALVSAVIDAPPLVDGALIVGDLAGRFVALDPRTGSPLGPGYMLRANVAPDAAAVPFGPGRVLVPLNDGTLLLLPLAKLR